MSCLWCKWANKGGLLPPLPSPLHGEGEGLQVPLGCSDWKYYTYKTSPIRWMRSVWHSESLCDHESVVSATLGVLSNVNVVISFCFSVSTPTPIQVILPLLPLTMSFLFLQSYWESVLLRTVCHRNLPIFLPMFCHNSGHVTKSNVSFGLNKSIMRPHQPGPIHWPKGWTVI